MISVVALRAETRSSGGGIIFDPRLLPDDFCFSYNSYICLLHQLLITFGINSIRLIQRHAQFRFSLLSSRDVEEVNFLVLLLPTPFEV